MRGVRQTAYFQYSSTDLCCWSGCPSWEMNIWSDCSWMSTNRWGGDTCHLHRLLFLHWGRNKRLIFWGSALNEFSSQVHGKVPPCSMLKSIQYMAQIKVLLPYFISTRRDKPPLIANNVKLILTVTIFALVNIQTYSPNYSIIKKNLSHRFILFLKFCPN